MEFSVISRPFICKEEEILTVPQRITISLFSVPSTGQVIQKNRYIFVQNCPNKYLRLKAIYKYSISAVQVLALFSFPILRKKKQPSPKLSASLFVTSTPRAQQIFSCLRLSRAAILRQRHFPNRLHPSFLRTKLMTSPPLSSPFCPSPNLWHHWCLITRTDVELSRKRLIDISIRVDFYSHPSHRPSGTVCWVVRASVWASGRLKGSRCQRQKAKRRTISGKGLFRLRPTLRNIWKRKNTLPDSPPYLSLPFSLSLSIYIYIYTHLGMVSWAIAWRDFLRLTFVLKFLRKEWIHLFIRFTISFYFP